MTSFIAQSPVGPGARRRGAFTLVEVLVTVSILGIAGTLVIPAMTQTNGLRVQAAVRLLVSDIAFVQADAMAYQSRRAIQFGRVATRTGSTSYSFENGNGYTLAEPSGAVLDLNASAMIDPSDPTAPLFRNFDDGRFGGASISNVNINGGSLLVFDELGGPVATLTGSDPASGTIDVSAVGDSFRISIAPYTGYISVTRNETAEGQSVNAN